MYSLPPQPEPDRSFFDSEERYQNAIRAHRAYEARRAKINASNGAFLILAAILLAATVGALVVAVVYEIAGLHGVAWLVIAALGFVQAHRAIKVRL